MSHSEIERFGRWYHRAHEYIWAQYPDNPELFCDLLAATSPRSSVKANWKSARRLYVAWIREGTIDYTAIIMRTHLPNVRRAFAHEPLSGYKVSRFAANLKGNWQVVTIDVWMCAHFGIRPKDLTPEVYENLERMVQVQAYRHGVTPCEYQAYVWQVERTKAGFKPTSFLAASADERQMEFAFCS